MIVGCYSLDLYCSGDKKACPHRLRHHDGADAQFTAEHSSTCRKEARTNGWWLTRDESGLGVAFCRDCKKAARRAAKGVSK